jgi:hypothetical protein
LKVVYKYVLHLPSLDKNDTLTLDMPRGAKSLHVAEQSGHLCLWALVNPAEKTQVPVRLAVHGTGHAFDHAGVHLGSGLLQGGRLVLHVFLLKQGR